MVLVRIGDFFLNSRNLDFTAWRRCNPELRSSVNLYVVISLLTPPGSGCLYLKHDVIFQIYLITKHNLSRLKIFFPYLFVKRKF